MKARAVNLRKESYDVYVGRSGKGQTSIWGNPYFRGTRNENIRDFESYLFRQPRLIQQLPLLKGKRLGCFCKPLACHGDILAVLAEKKWVGYVGQLVTTNEGGAMNGNIVDARIDERGLIHYNVRLLDKSIEWFDEYHVYRLEGKRHGIKDDSLFECV